MQIDKMEDIYLMEFIMQTKEIFGSCSILDSIPEEDIPQFAKFTKIVWNYLKMQKIAKDTK